MTLKGQDVVTLVALMSIIFIFSLFRLKDKGLDYREKEEYRFQIDINQADKTEFMLVPGIGSAMAENIISRRDEMGGFRSLEDLKEIRGIGQKTFLRISPFLKIDRNGIKEQQPKGSASDPLAN